MFLLMASFFSPSSSYAKSIYLEDVNNVSAKIVDPGTKNFNLKFPKIMLAENVILYGDMERYSKYDIIQTHAFQSHMKKISELQAIYPALKYFRQLNLEFLGYSTGLYCNQGYGIPFETTTGKTQGCSVYAGHWLYEPGTKTGAYLNSSSTTVSVTDVSRIKAGEYAVIYDAPAGSFKNAEHVKISAVDAATKKVTLVRGYKSTVAGHAKNSIIAMHIRGQANSPINWMYNLSAAAPVDGNGNRYIDYVAQWLITNYNRDHRGIKHPLRVDGIAFDIDFKYSITKKNADTNNDLSVDFGILAGQGNAWGSGVDTLYTLVRNNFPGLYISGGISGAPGHGYNNGVQLEGWPVAKNFKSVSPDYGGIDGRLSDYMLRHREHIAPQYFHALSKTPTLQYSDGTSASSNSPFRFAFGTALLGDGFYGQQNSKKNPDPWYDEYAVDVISGSSTYGTAQPVMTSDESQIRKHKGWLGMPLGDRVRVYDDIPFQVINDQLAGKGTFDINISGWSGANITLQQDFTSKMDGQASLRTSKHKTFDPVMYSTSIKGPSVSLTKGKWYTLVFSMKADRVRQIKADIAGVGQSYMINDEWRRYVMAFKAKQTGLNSIKFQVGREDTPVWLDSVRIFEGNPNVFRRDFENGTVVVNATEDIQVVDLKSVFQRINGNQDAINDGKNVQIVTIAPYDAAILVRPDGNSGPPVPPAGLNECGAPVIDAGNAAAIYLWKDCQGDGSWSFRITGGGSQSVIKYAGDITSDKGFSFVSGYSLESSDVLNTSDPFRSTFKLNALKTGVDGVNFNFPLNSNTCFNATTHPNVLIGSAATPASLPLNLGTLLSCSTTTGPQPGDECGVPNYDASAEQGAFLWKDCAGSGTWYLRVTAGGSSAAMKYLGSITSASPVTVSNYSIESSDNVDSSIPGNVSFKMNVLGKGVDGLDISPGSNGACLGIPGLAGGNLYLGSSKVVVTPPLDLLSLGSC